MDPNLLYTRLDPSKKQIRLLQITTTSPRISCRLSTSSLNDDTAFCALTYVWGDPMNQREVWVNDTRVSVTNNLVEALTDVQEVSRGQGVPELRLWVDAICINQSDDIEKNHQVPLMKDIYSAAAMTFSFLGSSPSTSDLCSALDCFSVIASRLENGDYSTKQGNDSIILKLFEDLPLDPAKSELPHPEVPEIGIALPSWNSQLTEYASLLKSLAYWKRAWIFQELVLSRKTILFYKDRCIEFENFAKISEWASNISAGPKPSIIHPLTWYFILSLAYRAVRVTRLVRNVLYQYRTQTSDRKRNTPTIRQLGHYAMHLQATNPKDYVYALLGISGLEIVPRYETTVAVASVYVEFCAKQMEHNYSDPLKFLNKSGLANGNPGHHNLPSWVPNLPIGGTEKDFAMIKSFSDLDTVQTWSEFTGHSDKTFIQNHSLFLSSLLIDSVDDVSEPRPSYGDKRSLLEYVLSIFKMLDRAFQDSKDSFCNDCHPFLKLTSAFYQTRITSSDWDGASVL
ncbi:uncharacterized protein FIESC28_03455 [Fusarium coffeatum]|uniref:Heterokaryon incompatibility domain-containing protein n=1 Tax=Fusarium coffeatum TaxID=231269 RepID=A0A366S501_9HYPO|nr:uncharacterized protein FIESC28_03455 [Fusarium coffeatum]RBR23750.1 hypothetical protein FIESC28_03455 [Fusarium coffeatum]